MAKRISWIALTLVLALCLGGARVHGFVGGSLRSQHVARWSRKVPRPLGSAATIHCIRPPMCSRPPFASRAGVIQPRKTPPRHGATKLRMEDEDREGDEFKAERVPLSEFFNEGRAYILSTVKNPRSYEWDIEQVDELFQNIVDEVREENAKGDDGWKAGNAYALGDVILRRIPCSDKKVEMKKGKMYTVYDGQQRFVTVAIFIACIRDRLKELKELETSEEAKDELEEHIVESSKFLYPKKASQPAVCRVQFLKRDMTVFEMLQSGGDMAEFESAKNLTRPVDLCVCKNWLHVRENMRYMGKEEVIDLKRYLTEMMCVVRKETVSERMARDMVLNQGKGKQIENIDSILFKICCDCFSDDEKTLSEFLDRKDEMLQHDRNGVQAAVELLAMAAVPKRISKVDKLFNAYVDGLKRDRGDTSMDELGRDVFDRIAEACRVMEGLKVGAHPAVQEHTGDPNAKDRPCLAFLEMVTRASTVQTVRAVLLHLLLELKGEPELLCKRLVALERVAFWYALRPKALRVDVRHKEMRDMLDGMRDESSANDPYNLTPEMRQSCVEELGGAFMRARISVATAVLLKLNAAQLWDDSKSDVRCVSPTLEHVLPQKVANQKSWIEDWPDKGERDEWTHRIGNMAIVDHGKNARMGNSPFSMKSVELAKSSFPLTRRISDCKSWTAEDAGANQELVVQLAKTYFHL